MNEGLSDQVRELLSAEYDDATSVSGALVDLLESLSPEDRHVAMSVVLQDAKVLPGNGKKIGHPPLGKESEEKLASLGDAARNVLTQYYEDGTDRIARQLCNFIDGLDGEEKCFVLSKIITDCRVPHVSMEREALKKSVDRDFADLTARLVRERAAIHAIVFHLFKSPKDRAVSVARLLESRTVEETVAILAYLMREIRLTTIFEMIAFVNPQVLPQMLEKEEVDCQLLRDIAATMQRKAEE